MSQSAYYIKLKKTLHVLVLADHLQVYTCKITIMLLLNMYFKMDQFVLSI
jgi:hypothetical protein